MIKKLKYIVFIFTFVFLMLISLSALASEYKTEVKVGLKYGAAAGNSVTVSSSGGVNVYDAVSGTVLYNSQPKESVYIEMGSTGFASWDKFDAGGYAKISVQPIEGNIVNCDGTEYRGYIYLERRTSGDLLVINYVGIDEYVSSVLGREMSYTWPMEALKAQAVCARNFVLTRGNTHREYGFDVCTSTHCQVYGGVKSEHENTRRAVAETSGIVATYKGELVGLYFFATSGGATEDVENVWGGKYGYLKSVEDPYENPEKASRYSWTVTYSKEQIEEKLLSSGVDIGDLEKIEISSVTDTGRVLQMTFYGTKNSYTVKKEKCRTILGLYSQKFNIRGEGDYCIYTTSGSSKAPFYVLTANGTKPLSDYSALTGNGVLSEINIDVYTSDNYTITGGGYGHGVGMSQWGARGMAENGFTYEDILHHYFTDIELE